MQFLSPPERSVRDSAHVVDISLAVHTEIPLKFESGTCWRVLGELDASNVNIKGGKKRITDPNKSSKTAFIIGGVQLELTLRAYCLDYTIKAWPCMIINGDEQAHVVEVQLYSFTRW